MTTTWAPSTEAVEAAARGLIRDEFRQMGFSNVTDEEIQRGMDEGLTNGDDWHASARAALVAARPVLVAEALAEVERLRGRCRTWANDYCDVEEQRDEAREALAAVAALADEWDGNASELRRESFPVEARQLAQRVDALRAVLADHAATVANIRADAWDEGAAAGGQYGHEDDWTSELNPLRDNPYRTTGRTDLFEPPTTEGA